MGDSWDDRRRVKEEGFFDKANKEALDRLARRNHTVRLSPVTGKAMEQVTVLGIVVDLCQDSGGMWLDAGELEQIVGAAIQGESASTIQFLDELFKSGTLSDAASSAGHSGPRLSPISGKPLVAEAYKGITVDKCPESGGIWLDPGELQRAIAASSESLTHSLKDFFVGLLGRK